MTAQHASPQQHGGPCQRKLNIQAQHLRLVIVALTGGLKSTDSHLQGPVYVSTHTSQAPKSQMEKSINKPLTNNRMTGTVLKTLIWGCGVGGNLKLTNG